MGHEDNIHLHNLVVDLNSGKEAASKDIENTGTVWSDEALDQLPITAVIDGTVQTFPNAAEEEAFRAEHEAKHAENYRINSFHLGEGSPKQKFRANMDAIYMLKTLEISTGMRHRRNRKRWPIMSAGAGWQMPLTQRKLPGQANIRS